VHLSNFWLHSNRNWTLYHRFKLGIGILEISTCLRSGRHSCDRIISRHTRRIGILLAILRLQQFYLQDTHVMSRSYRWNLGSPFRPLEGFNRHEVSRRCEIGLRLLICLQSMMFFYILILVMVFMMVWWRYQPIVKSRQNRSSQVWGRQRDFVRDTP
jgi:hypothetical protein